MPLVADVSGYFLDGSCSDTTGGITGQVTESGTGKPLAGVLVSAYLSSQGEVRVLTDPTGHYFLPALTAGSWYVCYQADQPGLPPTTGGSSATGYQQACQGVYIPVTAGQVSTGIVSALAHGGAITGRVTDAAGHPLAGIVVQSAIGYNGVSDTGVRTGADGGYRLAGLGEADWKICFDATGYPAPGGLLHQCYLTTDATYSQPYSQAGTFVAVTKDHTAAGVDGQLHPGAAVSGRVTDPDGHPVPGIVVDPLPTSAPFTSTTTRADGSYLFTGLPPGAYSLCFYPYLSSSAPAAARTYDRQCYQQSFPYGAANLTLTAGHQLAGIDAHLDHGGSVRVSVTDPACHPLGHVTVTVDGTTQAARPSPPTPASPSWTAWRPAGTGSASSPRTPPAQRGDRLPQRLLPQPDRPVEGHPGLRHRRRRHPDRRAVDGGRRVRLTITDTAGHPCGASPPATSWPWRPTAASRPSAPTPTGTCCCPGWPPGATRSAWTPAAPTATARG